MKMPRFLRILSIIFIAGLITYGNGGIRTGSSNHSGLVPVVRRILDPQYLPGDFNIEMRLFHHREFAYLAAAFSWAFGEDAGLAILSIISLIGLSASLYYLCRTMRLPLIGFLAAGTFVAFAIAWTGWGFEENTFVGNHEIQPPIFAHALILIAAAMLMQGRYHIPAFLAGLTLSLHLQIGAIFTLMIAPFYAARLKSFGIKGLGRLAVVYLAPAIPAFWHVSQMLRRGVTGSGFSLEYLDFRMPHHFELSSAEAGYRVIAHFALQIAAFIWLKKIGREEGRFAGVMLALSAALMVLAAAHFTEYYLLKDTTILKFQFLRVSPVITVFGALSAILALNTLAERVSGRGRLKFAGALVYGSLLAIAGAYLINQFASGRPEYSLRIQRYVDRGTTWVDACLWVRDNGPRDTVYLTPPGSDGFTSLTSRSNVAEFKINPDGAQYLTEWYDRLRDLCGGNLPAERGLRNRRPLNKAFGSLSDDQLIALGSKYKAAYAVLPQSSKSGFETLYRNKDFRVVKIPPVTGISAGSADR